MSAHVEGDAARRSDHADVLHGVEVRDPYRWLEDETSAETLAWIESQRRRTAAWMRDVPQREAIRSRMAELWSTPRRGTPVPRGTRLFYSENDGTREQPLVMVMDHDGAAPRVLVDPSAEGDRATFVADWAPSPDGSLLAWARSEAGSDWREWRVRDAATGRERDDVVRWSKFATVAWKHDGSGFWYEAYDAPSERPMTHRTAGARIRFHRLGTTQHDDELTFVAGEDVRPYAAAGEDGRWLVLKLRRGGSEGVEIHLQDLRDGSWRPMLTGFSTRADVVAALEDGLYLLTDRGAPNRRLVRLDPALGVDSPWATVIGDACVTLLEAALVDGRWIVVHLVDAAARMSAHEIDGRRIGDVALEDPVAVPVVRRQPGSGIAYFETHAFHRPPVLHRLDVAAVRDSTWWSPSLRFDPSRYVTRRVTVPGRDGAPIPVFLVHRDDIAPRSDVPTCLYGYGGFNNPMTPRYGVSAQVFMEMGGLYVQAAVRGGGERGVEWHRAAMRERRQNVFDDFVAVSEWLIADGWTSREKLAITGHSNGGLLVGACMTQRPDLFAAALPGAGVLDMLRFHRFTIGWAWMAEYGDPDVAADFAVLRAYSPLHNVEHGARYPATLIVAAEGDDRVVPCHSYKFAAELQAAQAGDAPILARIEPRAGHGAGTSVSQVIEEQADRIAFLARTLGMPGPRP